MTHTPTPWYNDASSRTIKSLANLRKEDGRKDFNICRMGSRPDNHPISHEEWIENAAFIVKSANCHDELVAIVKELSNHIEYDPDGVIGKRIDAILTKAKATS